MKLSDADILRLLPEHISGDAQFSAAGQAANKTLAAISKAIPNLLIWARLGQADPAHFLPPLRRLTEARPGLAELDIETLESLAWQFHVDFREVARTKQELAGMVLNSIPWHRIKGTPASIRAALDLFGYTGIKIEEDGVGDYWATYQLGLSEIVGLDDIARIVAICTEMQPARCRLWRVYNDEWDQRPGIWGGENTDRHGWSNFWWSFYSGVEFPEIPGDGGGLIVSFGQSRRAQTDIYLPSPCCVGVGNHQGNAYLIPYLDHFIWSDSAWGDVFVPSPSFVFSQVYSVLVGQLIYESGSWDENPWGDKPWGTGFYYGRKWPEFSFHYYTLSKSQLVHGDGSDKIFDWPGWGDLNANWSVPDYEVMEASPLWSDFEWGFDEPTLKTVHVDEQTYDSRKRQSEIVAPDCRVMPGAGVTNSHAFQGDFRDHPVWGTFAWGEDFPPLTGFIGSAERVALAGVPVWQSHAWEQGGWNEKPWGEIAGYDNGRERHVMLPESLAKSQLVHGDVSDKPDTWSGFGDINSNWGERFVDVPGQVAVWGEFAWSDEEPPIVAVPVLEEFAESRTLGANPPEISGISSVSGSQEFSRAIAGTGLAWGEFFWGDIPPSPSKVFGEQRAGILIGSPLMSGKVWQGEWAHLPWGEIVGYGRAQRPVGVVVTTEGAING